MRTVIHVFRGRHHRRHRLFQFYFRQRFWDCLLPSVLWSCRLGGRKGIQPVKTWVVGYWHGYLSGARCRRGDWKCETWKYGTVKNAGVENARHEFAAPDCRGGKCETWKCGTKLQGWKMREKLVWKAKVRKSVSKLLYLCAELFLQYKCIW